MNLHKRCDSPPFAKSERKDGQPDHGKARANAKSGKLHCVLLWAAATHDSDTDVFVVMSFMIAS
jgi:hypothetical protein